MVEDRKQRVAEMLREVAEVQLELENLKKRLSAFADRLEGMPKKLPMFKGYTVDERLREFRKLNYGEKPEFIPFDSPQGQKLLSEMEAVGQ